CCSLQGPPAKGCKERPQGPGSNGCGEASAVPPKLVCFVCFVCFVYFVHFVRFVQRPLPFDLPLPWRERTEVRGRIVYFAGSFIWSVWSFSSIWSVLSLRATNPDFVRGYRWKKQHLPFAGEISFQIFPRPSRERAGVRGS